MYNPYSLEGKTILVTGASSGIGKAIAIECSKLGACIIIVGRNIGRLESVYSELATSFNQNHKQFIKDLSSEEDLSELISQLPKLDGVASNAGIAIGNTPIKFIKDDDLKTIFGVNTVSHVLLSKLLFKKKILKNNSSYVFTSSIGGNVSWVPGNSIYGMTKAAINSFMKYCAIEFAPRGIRCNSVCPGMINTPLVNLDSLTEEDKMIDAEKYLLKRYGEPIEVARTVAFLLSDAASFITGSSIVVDGGYSVNH